MNVQFRSAPSTFIQPLAFAGDRMQSPASAKSSRSSESKKERQSPTGRFSLVFRWVTMSLNLIRQGKAEQRTEGQEAKKTAHKSR